MAGSQNEPLLLLLLAVLTLEQPCAKASLNLPNIQTPANEICSHKYNVLNDLAT